MLHAGLAWLKFVAETQQLRRLCDAFTTTVHSLITCSGLKMPAATRRLSMALPSAAFALGMRFNRKDAFLASLGNGRSMIGMWSLTSRLILSPHSHPPSIRQPGFHLACPLLICHGRLPPRAYRGHDAWLQSRSTWLCHYSSWPYLRSHACSATEIAARVQTAAGISRRNERVRYCVRVSPR